MSPKRESSSPTVASRGVFVSNNYSSFPILEPIAWLSAFAVWSFSALGEGGCFQEPPLPGPIGVLDRERRRLSTSIIGKSRRGASGEPQPPGPRESTKPIGRAEVGQPGLLEAQGEGMGPSFSYRHLR